MKDINKNITLSKKIRRNILAYFSDGSSIDLSNRKIFGTELDLPSYVKAGPRKFYRLRKVPAVVRTHASKRKEEKQRFKHAETTQ